MLVEMKSPAFMDHGQERRLTTFHGGLNVVLGEEDGAMSIGKSSSLLAIDFAFGGDTYIKTMASDTKGITPFSLPSNLKVSGITSPEIPATAILSFSAIKAIT